MSLGVLHFHGPHTTLSETSLRPNMSLDVSIGQRLYNITFTIMELGSITLKSSCYQIHVLALIDFFSSQIILALRLLGCNIVVQKLERKIEPHRHLLTLDRSLSFYGTRENLR